ncbi:response regulator [Pseudoclavibacter sp. CFCC 11306]|nr:response regulator [Pseudoclavibacter sp. CFCC 11306]
MMTDHRVLIVDDDFRVADLHARYVDAVEGFSALEPVHSGRAAIEAVRHEQPDLLLLDLYLPDVSGISLLREIDVDAFVLSAANDAVTVRQVLRSGALGMLIKPFARTLLTARLEAYLRYRRVLREGTQIDQEAVERAQRILHSGDAAAPRSRSETERAVVTALEEAQDVVSAQQVADSIGVSRSTAQRYLTTLAGEGIVQVQLQYGQAGRPEHRYRLVR